jgi:tetratricopeptide (TPR) repeat protein
MQKLVLLGILLAWSVALAPADETADRMAAARELMKAYKNSEALAAFTNLAVTSTDDKLKSEALESAAYCALRQRHNNPAMIPLAMELAKQIPLKGESVKCRMVVLAETGQNGELIKQFKEENLAVLPEDIAAETFFMRGRSYAWLKKGPEAEADFKMALERSPKDQKYLMALAGNYYANLKDTQKALDTYEQIIKSADKPHHAADAVMEVARILVSNAQYEKALKALENFKDVSALSDYQRVQVLRAFGQVYAGLGREEEAVASFNKANRPAGTK